MVKEGVVRCIIVAEKRSSRGGSLSVGRKNLMRFVMGLKKGSQLYGVRIVLCGYS